METLLGHSIGYNCLYSLLLSSTTWCSSLFSPLLDPCIHKYTHTPPPLVATDDTLPIGSALFINMFCTDGRRLCNWSVSFITGYPVTQQLIPKSSLR